MPGVDKDAPVVTCWARCGMCVFWTKYKVHGSCRCENSEFWCHVLPRDTTACEYWQRREEAPHD